jgi:hypothetical protein
VAKKKAKKPVRKQAPKTKLAAKPAPEPLPKVVVFFELNGVAGVRFHGEYADADRARLAARSLVSSPDVAHAWILQDLEIVRKPAAM